MFSNKKEMLNELSKLSELLKDREKGVQQDKDWQESQVRQKALSEFQGALHDLQWSGKNMGPLREASATLTSVLNSSQEASKALLEGLK